MLPKITYITGNKNKLLQVQKFMSIPLEYKDLDLAEIQSLDLQEIVKHKAIQAFMAVCTPVLIDDVSIIFPALGKLPGPFIKWFLKELKPEGICNLLSKYPDKSAVVELCLGYYDGKDFQTFSESIKGSVAEKPVGENGFGFDVLFIPEGYTITRAQMNTEDFEKTSPRKAALMKFEEYLKI